MIVGYCATCRHLARYASERPVMTLERFGRCRLGVRPINGYRGMCDRWALTKPKRKRKML